MERHDSPSRLRSRPRQKYIYRTKNRSSSKDLSRERERVRVRKRRDNKTLKQEEAENQARNMLRILRNIRRKDIDEIKNVMQLLLEAPAYKIRDFELREFLEDALQDYQAMAENSELYKASASAFLFGYRLELGVFQDQAQMFGVTDPSNVNIDEIAEMIQNSCRCLIIVVI